MGNAVGVECVNRERHVEECRRLQQLEKEVADLKHRLVQTSRSYAHGSRDPPPAVSQGPAAPSAVAADTSSHWLNELVRHLWPSIGEFVEKTLRETVEPAVQKAVPWAFKGVRFDEIDFGSTPVQFKNMDLKPYTYQTSDEGTLSGLQLSMDIVYKGDATIYLSAVGGVKIGVSDIQLADRLVVDMPRLLPAPPFLFGLSIYFPNPPKIEMDWRGVANILDLKEFKVLQNMAKNIVQRQVCNAVVLPNRIAVVLNRSVSMDVFTLKRPRPSGVLRLTIMQARLLQAGDVAWVPGMKGSSDPYVVAMLGSQEFKTDTVRKSLNPVWKDHRVDFLVDVAAEQNVIFEVFDQDMLGEHDFLGSATVPVTTLIERRGTNFWYALEDSSGKCKELGSELQVHASWRPLCLDYDMAQMVSHTASDDVSCLLFVGIYSACGLPAISLPATYWLELSAEGETLTSKHVGPPEVAPPDDEATAAAVQAHKVMQLLRAGVDEDVIADVLDIPVGVVQGCRQQNQIDRCSSEVLASSQAGALLAPTHVAITWEQGFVFLLRDPLNAEITFKLCTDAAPDGELQKGSSRVVGEQVSYLVKQVVDRPNCTCDEQLELDIDGSTFSKLSSRMQVRVLGHEPVFHDA